MKTFLFFVGVPVLILSCLAIWAVSNAIQRQVDHAYACGELAGALQDGPVKGYPQWYPQHIERYHAEGCEAFERKPR